MTATTSAPSVSWFRNSTSVRAVTGSVCRWERRAGLSTLGVLAPSLAARWLARSFLTPPRHRALPPERDALAAADGFVLPFGRGLLRAWRWGEGPAVLLVHGWGGRGGQLMALAAPILRAGCAVVTFDGPAHGSSTGRTASVRDFARAVAAVAERVGARAAIAHSMGAPAVALALAGGLSLDAAVFVAPPLSPIPFLDRLFDAVRAPGAVRERARARLERRIGAALADLDLGRSASAMRTPLLVIHDRADREVPWASGAAIASSWPGAELLTTEGLGHRRILASREVSEQATGFVVRHLTRCACGRLASEAVAGEPACSTCAIEQELFRRGLRRPPLSVAAARPAGSLSPRCTRTHP